MQNYRLDLFSSQFNGVKTLILICVYLYFINLIDYALIINAFLVKIVGILSTVNMWQTLYIYIFSVQYIFIGYIIYT